MNERTPLLRILISPRGGDTKRRYFKVSSAKDKSITPLKVLPGAGRLKASLSRNKICLVAPR